MTDPSKLSSTHSGDLAAATPEMVAVAMFGARFRCCVCGREHQRLNKPAQKCFGDLISRIRSTLVFRHEFSSLVAILMNAHLSRFRVEDYRYVLAAPSVEAAQQFLQDRNKEWLDYCRRMEEKALDPERELPPILKEGTNPIRFEGYAFSLNLLEDGVLKLILKDERVAWVAHVSLSSPGYAILDIQWKKIGEPGTLLLSMPYGTSNLLLNSRHLVKFVPTQIKSIPEAITYLEKNSQLSNDDAV